MSAPPSVWVLGATGYAGVEAVRLLRGHPRFRLDRVCASPGSPERDLGEIEPALATCSLRARPFETSLLEDPPQAAVLALPDEAAAALVPAFLDRGARVVDLSGAFRLRERSHYPRYCGFEHPRPRLLDSAVYGLTEQMRETIRDAALIANPGCYPTAALLALLPLESSGLLDPESTVVVDAKSGVTGVGRRLEAAYLFAEVNENLRPYHPLHHRHVPEILQALGFGEGRDLLFVPHLLPVARGLLATVYVRLRHGVGAADFAGAYAGTYGRSPFVRLLGEGRWPELRGVARTNRCDIGWVVDPGRRAAVVFAAIDNLLKGAAGQAVQNLNLMFGRPEEEGLPA